MKQLTPLYWAPQARTDLSRLDINIRMPKALAMLIIDLFDLLPEQEAKEFPALVTSAVKRGANLSDVPAQLLHWLLVNKVFGLVNLVDRPDVLISVTCVANDILFPQTLGETCERHCAKTTILNAELVQQNAWLDFSRSTGTANAPQKRIDWMVASAATDATREKMPSSLTSAIHSAAVAWATYSDKCGKESTSTLFYQAVRDQFLKFLSLQPANFMPRDRVAFDDLEHGPQTGTILGLIPNVSMPAFALILIDHELEGMTWKVPVLELSPLEAVAA